MVGERSLDELKMILCNICVPCILRFINVGCFFFRVCVGLLVENLGKKFARDTLFGKLKNLFFPS